MEHIDLNNAFLALLWSGLWENDNVNIHSNLFEGLDWGGVLRLAEAQSVVGLVTAGALSLTTINTTLTEKLKLVGLCQLIE